MLEFAFGVLFGSGVSVFTALILELLRARRLREELEKLVALKKMTDWGGGGGPASGTGILWPSQKYVTTTSGSTRIE